MVTSGLNDSGEHGNFLDKLIYNPSIFLLTHIQLAPETIYFQWLLWKYLLLKCATCIMIKRDYTYYWFTLKDTERKWLIWSSTILLYIRFLHKPQLWFWLFPFFSKQGVKTERFEVFQTMAKHKEKEGGNWNEFCICEIDVLKGYLFCHICDRTAFYFKNTKGKTYSMCTTFLFFLWNIRLWNSATSQSTLNSAKAPSWPRGEIKINPQNLTHSIFP